MDPDSQITYKVPQFNMIAHGIGPTNDGSGPVSWVSI